MMIDTILIHGLFLAAVAYLAWRVLGPGRRRGCGGCPHCPSASRHVQRDKPQTTTTTLTISAARTR